MRADDALPRMEGLKCGEENHHSRSRGMMVSSGVKQRATHVALCIGNSKYTSSPLQNAANDAQDVAALCRKLGFATELVTEASLEVMLGAVEAFVGKLSPGGVRLFFFAGASAKSDGCSYICKEYLRLPSFPGHGVQVNDTNYLIPVQEVESDALLDYKALRVQHVLQRVETSGCNLNLIILDACRNKPSSMRSCSRSLGRGLAKMDASVGSVIAFACAPGETARVRSHCWIEKA